jgi:hypothetical protein
MRDLYATTLQLVHLGDGDPFDVACLRALDWACRRLDGPAPDLAKESSGQRGDTQNGVSVAWRSTIAASARAFEVRLAHPDEREPTMRWQASVTISEVDGATRASVHLGMEATVHSLRPWHVDLRAPAVVRELMQPPLLSYAGSIELAAGPMHLDAEAVEPFMCDVLTANGRALPVLVISSEVSPRLVEALDRSLCGLVQVVHARDQVADEELRAVLARSGYTVPQGGLRLFWPDFGSRDSKQPQPYWTGAQLRQGRRDRSRSVVTRLVNLLAPISTGRVPVDPGVFKAKGKALEERAEKQQARNRAIRERARRNRQEAQRVKREAKALAGADSERRLEDRLSEVEALLDHAEGERDEAFEQVAKSKQEELKAIEEAMEHSERTELLEIENKTLRDNLRTITQFEAGGSREEEDEDDDIPSDVKTWDEISEWLPELEGPGFHVTDRALDCADGTGKYPHPDAMWQALRALERVGRAYNERGARLNMRFEEFAQKHGGIEVALQDGTYGDCWFEYEGKPYQRLPHVKIDDAKAPNEVGRIYFALDSDGRRVIVDWFGTKPERPNTKRTALAVAD